MQQVRCATVFQEIDSRPPGATAVGVMDLHHRPNGPWPSGAQSTIRRRVVLTIRSEILPIILVIHRKLYPTTDSSNHLMDIPTDNRGWAANSSSVARVLL